MGRIVGLRGQGGVDWRTLNVSNGQLPPGARTVLVVYSMPDGKMNIAARGDLCQVMTTSHAEAISTSVREFLAGIVRPKG